MSKLTAKILRNHPKMAEIEKLVQEIAEEYPETNNIDRIVTACAYRVASSFMGTAKAMKDFELHSRVVGGMLIAAGEVVAADSSFAYLLGKDIDAIVEQVRNSKEILEYQFWLQFRDRANSIDMNKDENYINGQVDRLEQKLKAKAAEITARQKNAKS